MAKITPAVKGYESPWRDESVVALYDEAVRFFESTLVAHREKYEDQHIVDREVWLQAGERGLLCCSIPEEYGGGGGTFAHDLAVFEAQAHCGDQSWANSVHSGIVAHYVLEYGTEAQKQRWLPKMASGELVAAIAMTEPGAGSDLQGMRTRAVADGDDYVIEGSKIFISNGQQADLVLVAAKTDPEAGSKGISLIMVEAAECEGFTRGRNLDKVGQMAGDTSELFFTQARVPKQNLLGEVPGRGLGQLMAQLGQERLVIGVGAVGVTELAVSLTVDYTKDREAFGQPLYGFQNTQFTLAEAATEAHIGRVFLDQCIVRHLDGGLDTTSAAMVKWWLTEKQCKIVDECLQLFGGYGYMREYQIGRLFQDSRVQKIYGGANEIMKVLIARAL